MHIGQVRAAKSLLHVRPTAVVGVLSCSVGPPCIHITLFSISVRRPPGMCKPAVITRQCCSCRQSALAITRQPQCTGNAGPPCFDAHCGNEKKCLALDGSESYIAPQCCVQAIVSLPRRGSSHAPILKHTLAISEKRVLLSINFHTLPLTSEHRSFGVVFPYSFQPLPR